MHDLYNLYVGKDRPDERFSSASVGPFAVNIVTDYESQAQRLFRNASRSDTLNLREDDTEPGVSFQSGRLGEWATTATAQAIGTDTSMLFSDATDDGIADLCELLTFCTGRRVATRGQLRRWTPDHDIGHCCHPLETLKAAALAWDRRHALVSSKLATALLLFNEAIGHPHFQIAGGLFSTALDIIVSGEAPRAAPLSDEIKAHLRRAIGDVLDKTQGLRPEQRKGFMAILGGRIDQGPSTLHDNFVDTLIKFGVMPAASHEDGLRRVRFVNKVRNVLVHTGKLPKLSGIKKDRSRQVGMAVMLGMVPDHRMHAT